MREEKSRRNRVCSVHRQSNPITLARPPEIQLCCRSSNKLPIRLTRGYRNVLVTGYPPPSHAFEGHIVSPLAGNQSVASLFVLQKQEKIVWGMLPASWQQRRQQWRQYLCRRPCASSSSAHDAESEEMAPNSYTTQLRSSSCPSSQRMPGVKVDWDLPRRTCP